MLFTSYLLVLFCCIIMVNFLFNYLPFMLLYLPLVNLVTFVFKKGYVNKIMMYVKLQK